MYLKQIFLKNCGPIIECAFNVSFDENNNPKPLVLVGENGTGKSILLSYVVDALHEFFIQAGYKNLVGLQNTSNISLGHQMYKLSGYFNKKLGASNAFSSLIFTSANGEQSAYLSVRDISIQDAKTEISLKFPELIHPSLAENGANKVVSENKELYKKEHEKGCFVFFPDYRQEQPIWMNENLKQIQPQLMEENTQKPLVVESSQNENMSWLLDIMLDTSLKNPSTVAVHVLDTVVNILRNILKRPNIVIAKDARKLRGVNRIALALREPEGDIAFCPRINSLSEGQSTLLNMFLTILRYTDTDDAMGAQIPAGIVIIDEIENHLHEDLLANVLPALIKMFPKIQFIITTHSPIFLLGMKETFGADGFEIREMPTGSIINSEEYSQFQVMFDIVSKTDKVKKLIDASNNENELIITEGQTDWMHMMHAFSKLDLHPFHFLEYDDTLGESVLEQICRNYARIPHQKPIICIFDADSSKYLDLHNDFKNGIKCWGNNVYSFCIPIPDFRDADPNVSIEMYYSDNILKTETIIDGKKKCLYFSNELSYQNYQILNEADPSRAKNKKIKDENVTRFSNPYNTPWIKTKKEFAAEVMEDKISDIDY
ncbi:MAG: ATP-binding protein, partial [Alphaproteobacteria bacterium]|nr:ATP-binding protein [Alphaproteobacteria bacterium]